MKTKIYKCDTCGKEVAPAFVTGYTIWQKRYGRIAVMRPLRRHICSDCADSIHDLILTRKKEREKEQRENNIL